MFDNNDDDEDFLSSFFSEDEIRAIVEREREKSMNFAIAMLEELGPKSWYRTIPFKEKIPTILDNMLNYFLSLEEFEKCVVIRDAINYGKTLKEKI